MEKSFNKFLKNIFYGINVLLYLVFVALVLSIPDELYLIVGVLIFNSCLTCFLIFLDWEKWGIYAKSGQFKGFVQSSLKVFLLFLVLAMVNFLFFKKPKQWDLSGRNVNSLTEKSQVALNLINSNLDAKIFARKEEASSIRALLNLYWFENNKIKISWIDPDIRPDLVEKYKIDFPKAIHLSYKGRSQTIYRFTELDITNGIIRLGREKDPVLYFTKNHQEVEILRKDKEGLTHLIHLLRQSLFNIKTFDLMTETKIPKDANAVVIWGPQSGFHPTEISKLESFLERGGRLVVGLDPHFTSDPLKNLRGLLQKWGLKVSNDLVVDAQSHFSGSNGSIPVIQKFSEHTIVKGLKGPVFFPLSSSVVSAPTEKKGKVSLLMKTTPSPSSWAEKDFKEVNSGRVTFNSQVDQGGPIPIVGVWEGESEKGKILAFGNSRFIINGYSNFNQNFLFFMNSISWISGDGKLVSFTNPLIKEAPIFISSPQLGITFYFSVLFIPLLLVGLGVLVYRRKGLV